MKKEMSLKVLMPSGVFLYETKVCNIVAQAKGGSFGLLPNRLDCVAALEPGVLSYRSVDNIEMFIAVDEGTLVKTGSHVAISVRNAIKGARLEDLKELVKSEFDKIHGQERNLRLVMAKMESSFLQRFSEMQRE